VTKNVGTFLTAVMEFAPAMPVMKGIYQISAFWQALVEERIVQKTPFADWSQLKKFPTAIVLKDMKEMA
jgi:hypothetical protein